MLLTPLRAFWLSATPAKPRCSKNLTRYLPLAGRGPAGRIVASDRHRAHADDQRRWDHLHRHCPRSVARSGGGISPSRSASRLSGRHAGQYADGAGAGISRRARGLDDRWPRRVVLVRAAERVGVWCLARDLYDKRVANIAALVFAMLPLVRSLASDAQSDMPHMLFYSDRGMVGRGRDRAGPAVAAGGHRQPSVRWPIGFGPRDWRSFWWPCCSWPGKASAAAWPWRHSGWQRRGTGGRDAVLAAPIRSWPARSPASSCPSSSNRPRRTLHRPSWPKCRWRQRNATDAPWHCRNVRRRPLRYRQRRLRLRCRCRGRRRAQIARTGGSRARGLLGGIRLGWWLRLAARRSGGAGGVLCTAFASCSFRSIWSDSGR